MQRILALLMNLERTHRQSKHMFFMYFCGIGEVWRKLEKRLWAFF